MAEEKQLPQHEIFWHETGVTRKDREAVIGHPSVLIWLTGLSGSGKSTIAVAFQKKLLAEKRVCYVLDGDNVRHGLNKGLGFSKEDREENIRRIGEVGKLFVDAGIITVASFISPYRIDRDAVRAGLPEGDFVEVFVKASVEECTKRDTKGLYKKALAGEIKNFTGISDPYEEPAHPELVLDTETLDVDGCVTALYTYLQGRGIL
ncbi:MAG: adenylyl-sulfate kinase [Candidatus Woesearchaeota archaeon]|nr:MAG: adenylyl-sulfate kinase [Candidatus Woesearchaeota archaeon]